MASGVVSLWTFYYYYQDDLSVQFLTLDSGRARPVDGAIRVTLPLRL